jgi:putative ABC transport system permease protein
MQEKDNRKIAKPSRHSIFWRMWLRSLTVKRPQAVLAIASVVVGAAVASMLLSLYGDVRRKMTEEFRAYGPNVVLSPQESSGAGPVNREMDQETAGKLAPILAHIPGSKAVPVLYAVAGIKRLPPDPRLPEMENLVVVGADFAALQNLYPAWKVAGGANRDHAGAIIGSRVAALLHLKRGDSFQLVPLGASHDSATTENQGWTVHGIVSTGSSEDDQVFIPLASLQNLASLDGKISVIQLSISGEPAKVEQVVNELGTELNGVEARPVRQIVYSTGHVLGTIRWLTISLTALIVIIIALSVTATMTTIVLERRKDIAVMKALGAGNRLVMELFLTEGASLGLLEALAGFALGLGMASFVAARLFDVTLTPTWWILPAVALAGTALAVFATLLPVQIVRGVQPAAMLKGE